MAQMDVQDPDALYQSYSRGLYRLTGEEGEDSILDMMAVDQNQNNSQNVQILAADLGGGTGNANTMQAAGPASNAGKQTFTDTAAGYWLGVDTTDGIAKFSIGNSTKYIKWDGSSLTVVGGVSISSLDIPDTTTASSFHVDTSGNTWWGANVATGISGATASVTAAGAAVFKNIQMGGSTIQYVISDSGIFTYGDGSDGAATFDGSATPAGTSKVGSVYTLTRDCYYTDATISTGITVNEGGYRMFGTGTLTLNGTANIHRNGNDGGAAPGNAGGTGGAALADGYLKGSVAGQTGATGGSGGSVGVPNGGAGAQGTTGTAVSNSLGSNGANSGTGGAGGAGGSTNATPGGGASIAGVGGTATTANVKLIANWHLATLLDVSSTGATVKFNSGGGAAGGSSGGGGSSNNGAGNTGGVGGGGGGGASDAGIVAIYFRNIVIGASASITAIGGNGGAGASGGGGAGQDSGGGGGGSGGGGGNGGLIILVFNTITNSGNLTVTGGTGGPLGSGGGRAPTGAGGLNGSAGSVGANGVSGTTYQFKVSL